MKLRRTMLGKDCNLYRNESSIISLKSYSISFLFFRTEEPVIHFKVCCLIINLTDEIHQTQNVNICCMSTVFSLFLIPHIVSY